MQSVIFIIPYFGEWPEWMDLYIDSIQRNPTIDFLFITDCDTTVFNHVPNISYQKSTFHEYIDRYKKTIGDDIQVSSAYKICDLRPFFGIIHARDIEGYDFFGWTDVDLFFGDIRLFYTDKILTCYQVLSTHTSRLSGHCALLKNTSEYRNIGFKIYHWKEALKNPDFVGIDEHGITNALCMTFFDKVAEKLKYPTNTILFNGLRKWKTRKYYFVEQYTTPFTPIPWTDGSLNSMQPDEWIYDKGTITNKRDKERKFMYIHLMNFKSSKWRQDGTKAPWEGKEICMDIQIDRRITIDLNGIRSEI